MGEQYGQNAGERHRWEQWLLRMIPPDRYDLVLVLVLLTFIVLMVVHGEWGQAVLIILTGVTLLATMVTSRASRGWILLALILFIGGITAFVITLTYGEPVSEFPLLNLLQVLLLLLAPYFILRRISRQREVTVQSILGAVSVYFLFGIICALGYAVMGKLTPAFFFAGIAQADQSEYLFFSFTTLTTVGYGNLVPNGNAARTLAMLEAMLGQVYLVVVVARLVALWQAPKR